MTLIDGFKGSAAASGGHVVCQAIAQSRNSGCQRERLQRTPAPSLTFGWVLKAADITSAQPGSARCGFAQPRLTLSGSVDRRMSGGKAVLCNATSISGGHRMVCRKIGNLCAEKVWPHRSRQNKGAAPLTKAPSAFRRIGGAVRQGTLTITGSNVRLGTEMPVALSSFCK